MARFYVWSNNGVWAVASEAVFQEMEHRNRIAGEAREEGQELCLPMPRPVFTFSDTQNPGLREWLTGTTDDMRLLLEGHEVVRESFYVPFSNGYQWGTRSATSDDALLVDREHRFRTTLREAMDAFGLVPNPIKAGVR